MFAKLILVLVTVVFSGNAFLLGTLAGSAAADAMAEQWGNLPINGN